MFYTEKQSEELRLETAGCVLLFVFMFSVVSVSGQSEQHNVMDQLFFTV